ncbi:MAG: hypothetical protein JJ896_06880 [Rhodothermales bacterium]|nr:hypothetical protein [Rhodothermales bacterium]MBO6779361.1 hypothetical protein [Rhodothermales bacterium]
MPRTSLTPRADLAAAPGMLSVNGSSISDNLILVTGLLLSLIGVVVLILT